LSALDELVEVACVPLDGAHVGGTLGRASELVATHPDLAGSSVHAAAILGDAAAVRRHLAQDPGQATARGGPRQWDALTHLCFSRFLRLDPSRSPGFVEAATALLDAGASAGSGFTHDGEWECVLYGAAGVARNAGLTKLLLDRGADPNDGEVVYHAPESHDNAVVKRLVETGKLTADSLVVMLIRKHDWHDYEGVSYLLDHGADPNRASRWGQRAIHQALRRDNALPFVERLLDAGADPFAEWKGLSGVAMAARHGRGDVLELLEARGAAQAFTGTLRLVAACARGDADEVRAQASRQAAAVEEVVANAGELLGEFAGVGNTEGVRLLLDLGAPVDAPFPEPDGYFDITRGATALHVAAWRAWPSTVGLLLERGASVGARDGKGRTPLQLAVRACVDSYWTERRTPESVEALLRSGASPADVKLPTGYDAVDALLRASR
jgi:ankyrin repeat protein